MKKADIYLGNINVYDKIMQHMCLLLKIDDEYYANLELINDLNDFSQILTFKSGMSPAPDFVLSSKLLKDGNKDYVDVNSLLHFYNENEFEQDISILQVKSDWENDSRDILGLDAIFDNEVVHKKI